MINNRDPFFYEIPPTPNWTRLLPVAISTAEKGSTPAERAPSRIHRLLQGDAEFPRELEEEDDNEEMERLRCGG